MHPKRKNWTLWLFAAVTALIATSATDVFALVGRPVTVAVDVLAVVGRPATPVSYAGVARRTVRRNTP